MKLIINRDEDGEMFAHFENEQEFGRRQADRSYVGMEQVDDVILDFRTKLREVIPKNGFMVISVK